MGGDKFEVESAGLEAGNLNPFAVKVMKEEGTHEGCIEQLHRLFSECLYSDNPRKDLHQRFRVDDLELNPQTQAKVEALWPEVTEDNLYKSIFILGA